VNDDPAPLEHELGRGELALAMGEPEDAADAFQRALNYRPHDPDALLGLARSYLASGDGEAALRVLQRLGTRHPGLLQGSARNEYATALYQSAAARLERGEVASSLTLLQQLEQIDPAHPGLAPLHAEAVVAEARRQLLLGADDGDELGADRVPDADTSLERAKILLEAGKLDPAITLLSDALVHHPADMRLRALMDRALDIRYPDAPWAGGTGRRPSD
jgi:tetratricopeptide (TPR) repeat protein